VRGYDGEERVVVFVGWGGEAGFDYGASYRYWVVRLDVETAGDGGGDSRGEIVP
jgi:hypothetical protein